MVPFDVTLAPASGHGNGVRDKSIRLLQMSWLLQKSDQTIDDLAGKFGVSRRTIYRDLRMIEEASLPLISQRAGKGYRLLRSQSTAFA